MIHLCVVKPMAYLFTIWQICITGSHAALACSGSSSHCTDNNHYLTLILKEQSESNDSEPRSEVTASAFMTSKWIYGAYP